MEHNSKISPVSFAQYRLWILERLGLENPVYHIDCAYKILGNLNITILNKCINEIIRRHEILRTTFSEIDNEIIQIISPGLTIPISVIDLSTLPYKQRIKETEEIALRIVSKPFNLEKGPLLRIQIIQLAEDECILVIVIHHIICDGWSMSIFNRELMMLYDAFQKGTSSPLPELEIQYIDYVYWQRKRLQGELLLKQEKYWKQQLNNIPPPIDFPLSHPRPEISKFRGDQKRFILPKDVSDKFILLGQKNGCTLFMSLLAVLYVLLYRYTDCERITIGTPIAGRIRTELEDLIGLFINTLVLDINICRRSNFLGLLQKVREISLGAFSNQEYPFEKLVDEFRPERSLNRNPLFQVAMFFQNTPQVPFKLPGFVIEPFELKNKTTKFDLSFEMWKTDKGISVDLEYDTDLFDIAMINQLVGHLQTLLEGIVSDPGQKLEDIPMLTYIEQQQLLKGWNNTQSEFPFSKCIHELFEAQVRRTPDALAIEFEGRSLTYKELNEEANQLANYLRQRGVEPETPVGICVERSVEMVVGLLGILKAGGTYVPLDPTYPKQRLEFMLADSSIPILLTQQYLYEHLPHCSAKVILLDADSEISNQEKDDPEVNITPDNLAYIIYTSGSTGEPKGVMIHHKGVVNRLSWMQKVFHLNSEDRVLQKTPFGFDVSVWELYWPLITGASLVIARPEGHRDSTYLIGLINENRITVTHFVPSMLRAFLNDPQSNTCNSLKWVICSGEVLSYDLARYFFIKLPHTRLYNLYGPTETSIEVTYWQCGLDNERQIIPIGMPIANTQAYILNVGMQPVPIGVPGELYIGGVQVGRGYLNRPGLTGECFVPDPFSDQLGSRLYRTGDLVRYLSDGNIEYLGRSDHQVKIHGHRIELGEIETTLLQNPRIEQAVVLAREDSLGDRRLVAYLVMRKESALSVSEIQGYLKKKLPAYMIPPSFVFLSDFPLTPNGKVDRKALPAPDANRPDLESSFTAPSSSTEKLLADIWAGVLGLQKIGIHDNFFELGGDSILSIQIVSRAAQAGVKLTLKEFFQNQTIAEQAAIVRSTRELNVEQELASGSVPLTPIQHWFFSKNLSEMRHWNQDFLLQLRTFIEPDRLASVLNQLPTQHDALRLRFTHTLEGWQQSYVENVGVPITCVDMSDTPVEQLDTRIESVANQLQSGLDLEQGPLMRAGLFNLGSKRPQRLLLIIHHLVVDGISWRILLQDIQTLLRRQQLPAKTTSFKTWSEYLSRHAQSPQIQKELAYWQQLPWSRVGQLQLDRSGNNTVASARTINIALSPEKTRELLQNVPKAYHTQINDVLLTALALAWKSWSGESLLFFDLEGHGREVTTDEIDVSRTVGWFTTIFPVFLEIDQIHPGKALMSIKEQLRQIPSQGLGYGLLRYLDPMNHLRELPRAEICFNYLGQFDQSLESEFFESADESSGHSVSLLSRRDYVLEIVAVVIEKQLQIEWIYSDQLHQATTIQCLADEFLTSLENLIDHCLSPNAGGYTSSDFLGIHLDQDEIDQVIDRVEFDE